MKIVCISDTHGMHEKIGALPEGDILIHAGDFSVEGFKAPGLEELMTLNHWLEEQAHRHKLLIAGNHDFVFQEDYHNAKEKITNAIYLQDLGIQIEGLKVWGMPWTPPFMDWAFMAEPNEMKRYTEMISDDTDILITHGPPYGVMDRVGRSNVGSKDLLEAVLRVKPRVHIFGHIHEGYGVMSSDGITFVNACSLNVWYQATNKPIVVEV